MDSNQRAIKEEGLAFAEALVPVKMSVFVLANFAATQRLLGLNGWEFEWAKWVSG